MIAWDKTENNKMVETEFYLVLPEALLLNFF
jgi:hypothetical protein